MFKFFLSFRDELLATAAVLILTVLASGIILSRFMFYKAPIGLNANEIEKTLGAAITAPADTGVVEIKAKAPKTSVPPESPIGSASATYNPELAEVAYGEGATYTNDYFNMEVKKPRLEFISTTNTKRKLIVEIVIANKTVTEGITNRITATVVKDRKIIVPEAAMSNSETKYIMPGQKLTFTATLSLIEGTDVSGISFKPPGISSDVVHPLLAQGGP